MSKQSVGSDEFRPRVLLVHNAYQHRGGEDSVVEAELALLRGKGHQVECYFRDNHELLAGGRARAAMDTLWSARTSADMKSLFAAFKPDLIHVHNSFPLISPSLYWAAAKAGIPVVQTLHNFRLLCPQAMFMREGRVCEDCLGQLPWRGALHRCYRGSFAQTATLVAMLALHRGLRTYDQQVTRYIALNNFCRDKFIEGGLPAARVMVKPNFVDLPAGPESAREGGLFVGRLSPEKGLELLTTALDSLPDTRITVVGSGPLEARVAAHRGLLATGALPFAAIVERMRGARFLVLPSVWYENFPRTLVEAYACGLPVIASRLGALAELVEDGVTGLLFEAGSASDLASKLRWAQDNPQRMGQMGVAARAHYEAHYTAQRNYHTLMQIYAAAMAECGGRDSLSGTDLAHRAT